MKVISHCERSEAIQSLKFLDCRVAALLAMTVLLSLSACANKGKLQSPSQIAHAEEKKAKEAHNNTDNGQEKVPDSASDTPDSKTPSQADTSDDTPSKSSSTSAK